MSTSQENIKKFACDNCDKKFTEKNHYYSTKQQFTRESNHTNVTIVKKFSAHLLIWIDIIGTHIQKAKTVS